MIVFLISIFLVISIGINIAAGFLVKITSSKINIYEQYILDFKHRANTTLTLMRSIDARGSFSTGVNNNGKFENDDEVGQVFNELLILIEKLNEITEHEHEP